MIGQLDIDGNVEEETAAPDVMRMLGVAQANNANLMEQATLAGIDLQKTMDAGVLLQVRFAALHQFVMGSAPEEMRPVFDLLVAQKLAEVLQQVIDEATSKPKLFSV